MLSFGREIILPEGLEKAKNPHYDTNCRFDFSVFGEKCDYFIARSIWTHSSRQQITTCLDQFVHNRRPEGKLLVSYLPSSAEFPPYMGDAWLGISAESITEGYAFHPLPWLTQICHERGLQLTELDQYTFNLQRWLEIG